MGKWELAGVKCSAQDCEKVVEARGLCHSHYTAWWKKTPRDERLRLRMTDEERFLSKVAPPDENGCMVWTAGCYKFGYGMFSHHDENGRTRPIQAHLWAWRHWRGPTNGFLVCHTCDVPPCVNLDHLYEGTPQSNMDDKIVRGRLVACPGERNGSAKLTLEQVVSIRAIYTGRRGQQQELAREFGVTQGLISQIVTGKIWTQDVAQSVASAR